MNFRQKGEGKWPWETYSKNLFVRIFLSRQLNFDSTRKHAHLKATRCVCCKRVWNVRGVSNLVFYTQSAVTERERKQQQQQGLSNMQNEKQNNIKDRKI